MKDLSHLPKPEKEQGLVPDDGVRFGHLAALRESTRDEKPHAMDTPFRYSDAGKCARFLAYKLAGVDREPFDLATFNVFRSGTLLHEDWQAAMAEEYGDDVQFEVASSLDGLTSGSCDALLETDTSRSVVELKTVGGFKFKLATGQRGMAQGPSTQNIIQLALNVVGHDADEGVLVMTTTEAISKGTRGYDDTDPKRFTAEWTFTREQLQRYADKELARLAEIKTRFDMGELAPRHVPYEMPPFARIVDVDKSMWTLADSDGGVVDTGTLWSGKLCKYCPFQAVCSSDQEEGK